MTFRADSLGKTVLLVDSDPKLREARARCLALHGVAVHTASSIEEARGNLRTSNYALILLATREDPEMAIALHWEICQQNPKQKVAFLVGPPNYISFTYDEKRGCNNGSFGGTSSNASQDLMPKPLSET